MKGLASYLPIVWVFQVFEFLDLKHAILFVSTQAVIAYLLQHTGLPMLEGALLAVFFSHLPLAFVFNWMQSRKKPHSLEA